MTEMTKLGDVRLVPAELVDMHIADGWAAIEPEPTTKPEPAHPARRPKPATNDDPKEV